MKPVYALDEATDYVVGTLGSAADAEWQTPAGSLEWDCRFTAEHVASCLQLYALQLATQASDHYVSFFSRALYDATAADVLELVQASGRLLSSAVRAAKPADRGFHPFGTADADGFAGMGCVELLVHGGDIAGGLGLTFEPPEDVCAWTVARMFPDQDTDLSPWTALRYATGRTVVPGLPAVDENWRWQAAPAASVWP